MSNHTLTSSFRLSYLRLSLLLLGVVILSACGWLAWQRTKQPRATSALAAAQQVQENYGQVPLHFEANQGQFHESVKYVTRGKGYSIALTPQAAVLELQNEHSARVQMKLKGANPNPRIHSQQPLEAKVNYFLGNDPKQWKTKVPTFAQVKYEQVYPGTDVVYYGNQQQLEYDFIVAPHADPSMIKLEFAGAKSLRLDADGNLLLATAAGEIEQHKPIIYQETEGKRTAIPGSYRLNGNEVSFEVGEYDQTLPLVIDPVLAYSTFLTLGGLPNKGIAVDGAGNAYLVGSSGIEWWNAPPLQTFPRTLTRGAYVAKLSRDGSKVLYLTVIGGVTAIPGERECLDANNNLIRCPTLSLANQAYDVAVDTNGNAYVTGETTAADFPTTANAFQKTYPATQTTPNGTAAQKAAFALKLNAAGTLTYATLLGVNSEGWAIAVDANGQMVIAGRVYGAIPVKNAFQSSRPGQSNAFVTKFNAAGTELIYSTYLGSGSSEGIGELAFDQDGSAYVTGATGNIFVGGEQRGAPFPVTPGAYSSNQERGGIFVTKFDTTGSVIYSALLGGGTGGGNADSRGIAVDAQGCAYIVGRASEPGYVVTRGAYQTTKAHTSWETIITKLSADGSTLVYSTYFGKARTDTTPGGAAVDDEGNLYFANNRRYESVRGNVVTDTDVVKFSADGKSVLSSFEIPRGETYNLARDASGNIYLTGIAIPGFPTTLNSYRPYINGAFVTKVTEAIPTPLLAYTIAGTVLWDALGSRGSVFPGVKVLLLGAVTRSTIADDKGNYRFDRVPAGGDYYVMADPTQYKARGEQIFSIEKLDSHKVINFMVQDAYTPRTTIRTVSAASYQAGSFAAESIVSLFGSSLTTETKAAASLPLPGELGGAYVRIADTSGVERTASLFFVSPNQINFQIPEGTAPGLATVKVLIPGGGLAAEIIQIEATAPGLFSADSTGRGVAAANVQRIKASGAQSNESIAQYDVTRGQLMPIPIDLGAATDKVYLALFGTGVRNRRDLANVSATVGGINAAVTYAGSQNSYVGVDQINVMIPRELAGRGDVDVVLNVEGKPANVVKVKIK